MRQPKQPKRPRQAKIPPIEKLRARLGSLDDRERQVFDFVFQGYKGREIAKALGFSLRSIEGCKTAIFRKLRTSRIAIAIRYAAAADWPQGLPAAIPMRKWYRREPQATPRDT
jgi:FixJ family two-component response regulator